MSDNLHETICESAREVAGKSMLLWLSNRKEADQSFTFSEVCLENRDYALAIKREFGSWARALEEAFPTSDEGL